MSTSQLLKNAHYLSHTTTIMRLAWIVAALGRQALRISPGLSGLGK